MSKAPPGWYPHPSMADTQRYWDGAKWTDHIAPGIPPAFRPQPPSGPPKDDQSGMIAAGVAGAIIFPIAGFIIGIVLITRNKPGVGIGLMALSIFAAAFWYNVLTPDPSPAYYYGS